MKYILRRVSLYHKQPAHKRNLQGIVLLEILFATCFFSVATLALIASTIGVFQMHGKQDVSIEPAPGLIIVYNLEVDGTHNYYTNSALVHNKGAGNPLGCL